MTKMYQKFVAALLFMVGGACIVAVSSVREALWKETKATTRIGGPVTEEEKEREAEIERLSLIDDSLYDRISDIRYIRKLPSDPILSRQLTDSDEPMQRKFYLPANPFS